MRAFHTFFGVLVAATTVATLSVYGAREPGFKDTALPFLEKHCLECHGRSKTKGDLNLTRHRDDSRVLEDVQLWRSVLQQVNTGEMPPKKAPSQPTPEEITAFNKALENSIDKAEAKRPPDPGRVTARRLNRTEYDNTVRDLVGADFSASENFPADDIGHGFDNIGDVLSLSPVHLERYLDAADAIAGRVVLTELPKPPSRTTYSIFLEPSGYGSENGTRPVTNSAAELFVRHEIKVAGHYRFRVRAGMTNAPGAPEVRMALFLGDRELKAFAITNSPKSWKEFEVEVDLTAGENRFAARWLNRNTNAPIATLFVNEFKVVGPADMRTPFMRRMDDMLTGIKESDRPAELVRWFLTRAFRRPPTAQEMARYRSVYENGRAAGGGKLEAGLQDLVRAVLVSPKFLFRIEADDQPKSRKPQPLDEFQLASRLSYFLWSTMPDEVLLELASKRQLSAQIEPQVRRMLKDSRAEAMVRNFGLQWLQLQRLSSFQPDAKQFPDFDERLKLAMLRETELFLGEIVREDRSILDLVDADFTYLNPALARHYGLQGLLKNSKSRRGDFERVTLPDRRRGGLLTQASVLTATSNPTRTSPVKRGRWVLEQVLGTPPPPPPADVPALDEQHDLKGSLRQRMEQHRSNPACASCHRQMDAIGFAFENFDAIGRFRAKDADGDIDPSGTLPDGRSFQGPAELRDILKGRKELVARNLASKLMTYGIGRGLEFYDERAIRKVLADSAPAGYRFSDIILAIVRSDPFRLRRGLAADTEPTTKGS
jgi:hypothetical protein